MHIRVEPSTRPNKKLMAIAYKARKDDPGGEAKFKTVHFGQRGTGDYTTHNDEARKRSYLARHGATEDWGKSGMLTAGFLSKNVLWNKPTLRESIDDLNRRYKGANFGLVRGTVVPPPKPPKPQPKPPPKPIVAKTGPTIAASDLPPALARMGPLQLPPMPKRFTPVLKHKTDYRDTKYGPPR